MSRLDAYSGDDVRNCTLRCECGQPKVRAFEACDDCMFLDGKRQCESDVIAALRTASGWLSQDEICERSGRKPRTLHRLLAEMCEAGRLIRQMREIDSVEAIIRCRYGSGPRRAGTGGTGTWEYSLAEKRRAM